MRGEASVVEHVRAAAGRVAAGYGLEIFDVQFRREAPGMVLRVQIDRPGPAATAEDCVSVEDCARVMGLQKRLVRKRQHDRIGQRVRVLVDGPSADHDLVLKARLSTQAPDIDASVFLTECDPSDFRPGDFADVEIVGARDYDLIARP